MDTPAACHPSVDASFGPWAGTCRGGFDFTLLFEEVVLTLPLSCAFLLVLPTCVRRLLKDSPKVQPYTSLQLLKLVSASSFAILQLALLVLWATTDPTFIRHTPASVPTAALSFAASLGLCLLSYLEHVRSVRPSFVLEFYLFLSLLLDTARARTLWLLNQNSTIPTIFSCTIAIRCIMVVFESTEKRNILHKPYSDYPREAMSGIYSRSVFFWLTSLFISGYKKVLTINDLFTLDPELYSERLQTRFQSVWQKANTVKKGALFSTFLFAFNKQILLAIIPRLALTGFTFAQPFLINKAIEVASLPDIEQYNNQGYGLIAAYLLVYSGLAISNGRYEYKMYRVAIMLRGALISLVYHKTTTLGLSHVTPSAALTLISTDVEVITVGIVLMNEIWAALIEIPVAIYLLQRQLGPASAVPIGFALVCVVGCGIMAVFVEPRQKAWTKASEKRVATTAATLGSMKAIKISGLTKHAFSIITYQRLEELRISKGFRILLGSVVMLSIVSPIITPVLTFITFALLANRNHDTVTIERAFTSLALFGILHRPLSIITGVLPSFAGAMSSFGRIQDYLNIESRLDRRIHQRQSDGHVRTTACEPPISDGNQPVYQSCDPEIIARIDGKLHWNNDIEPVIEIRGLNVRRKALNMILGPVGCGKSTLLKCLLGECPGFEGSVLMNSNGVAYCEQSPWLPNGTVKEVITAYSRVDDAWYRKVLHACCLEEDISVWPDGDESLVGSKGISLSGGQKQRIALARALFSRKEFLILDDTLCGLDSNTEDRVFRNLFGDQGLVSSAGMTVLAASSDARRLGSADYIIVLASDGKLSEQGTSENLNNKDGLVAKSSSDELGGHSVRRVEAQTMSTSQPGEAARAPSENLKQKIEDEISSKRQMGDTTVYKYYLKSAGRLAPWISVMAFATLGFCDSFPTLWLKWWSESNIEHPNANLGKWLGVYSALGVGATISILIGVWAFFIEIISTSGKHFHALLANTVARAPMSFFSTVDSGITINRFSQDLQLIDMELPASALGTAFTVAYGVAQAVFMSIASRYFAAVIPVIAGVFYNVQHFYLRTSRQMRFLDIEYKAPLYSQLLETMSGLTTIRAFEWEDEFEERNRQLLDESQRPAYLLYCLQRWLTFTVDMIICAMAVILIVITVTLREKIGPGYMGVALVNIMAFGLTVKSLLTCWVGLEISIGAVARIKNFAEGTESEERSTGPTFTPPPGWPTIGTIEIRDLSANYSGKDCVLKRVSLSVRPGEKVGICGRTGSGKSSLVQCLFRMMNITNGSIIVDNVDLSTVPPETIRCSLVALPQEAYIFDGSIRLNADPSGSVPDDEMVATFRSVHLWEKIQQRGGLDAIIDSQFFSQGEKQLFSLARALLRRSKIVVLDEVTSSLDDSTSTLIDEVIRDKFFGCTVIAIAHKLSSILDFDKVAVLDEGELMEFDSPRVLRERESSYFRALYEASGQRVDVRNSPDGSAEDG